MSTTDERLTPARLRDEFAMAALQGIVIGRPFCERAFAAKSAYEFADAMLAARALPHPQQDGEA